MVEYWAFPFGVLLGYVLIVLFSEPQKETTGFAFGVWIMFLVAYFLR